MNRYISLNELKVGQKAYVAKLNNKGEIRRRLLDIGLIANTPVECVGQSPLGDPCAYLIRGAVIAIRRNDSQNILMKLCKVGDNN